MEGYSAKRTCVITEKMKGYKLAEPAGPDSDNEVASSVGSIGDADSVGEAEKESNLASLKWIPCVIEHAQLDAKGMEQLPQTPFLATEVGVNKEKLVGIEHPLHIPDHLFLFWSRPLCQEMIASTNKYGFAFVKGWKELDGIEFLAFLGIIIYLGCCSYPSRRAVWRVGIKGSAYIKRIMTRDRFNAIVMAWHFEDQTSFSKDELKVLKDKDPFWPVKRFVTELSNNYEALWTPSQHVDIDEQCVPWKGRHKCRVYNPHKPEKWHMKVFSLNDSANGYQCKFYLYEGKAENRPPEITATAFPAHQLLANDKYHNKGYILYTDNWFTSFQQLETCCQRGIDMVGTVKTNRAGIPDSFKRKKGQKQLKVRGEFATKSCAVYGNKTAYFTCWVDKKPVHLLHTVPTMSGTCKRLVHENGAWRRKIYTRPTIVSAYNNGMGGTDSGDQRMASYRTTLKTRKWIPRILSHCLNSSIVNLWIIYKNTYKDEPLIPKTHLQFREMLVDQLFEETLERNILHPAEHRERKQSKTAWNQDISRRTDYHFVEMVKKPEEIRREGKKNASGEHSNMRNYYRGHCMLCDKCVSTKCKSCGIYLCIINEGNNITCFEKFHTKLELFGDEPEVEEQATDSDSD